MTEIVMVPLEAQNEIRDLGFKMALDGQLFEKDGVVWCALIAKDEQAKARLLERFDGFEKEELHFEF